MGLYRHCDVLAPQSGAPEGRNRIRQDRRVPGNAAAENRKQSQSDSLPRCILGNVLTITAVRGDITEQEVDAVVNPETPLCAGVAARMVRFIVQAVQRSCATASRGSPMDWPPVTPVGRRRRLASPVGHSHRRPELQRWAAGPFASGVLLPPGVGGCRRTRRSKHRFSAHQHWCLRLGRGTMPSPLRSKPLPLPIRVSARCDWWRSTPRCTSRYVRSWQGWTGVFDESQESSLTPDDEH